MNHKDKISEEALLDLLKSKSRQGFELLYHNYAKALYGIIFKILNDKELAEDALQNTFIKIWQNIDTYDLSKGRIFTWILNIARNTAIDALRKKNNSPFEQTKELSDFVYISDENSPILQEVELAQIKIIIEQLSPEHQDLLDLIYFQGYTQAEISEKLNIPLGTVKSRIRSAIQQLRKLIN